MIKPTATDEESCTVVCKQEIYNLKFENMDD